MKKNWKSTFNKIPGILFVLIFIFAFFSFTTRGFFSTYNILNLLKNSSILVLVSFGMTIAILSGQIDISVGSTLSLGGVITVLCLQSGVNLVVAILIGLASGIIVGLINGYFIAIQKFNFWVVTFATMGIAQGIALVLSGGNVIPGATKIFRYISEGKLLGVYLIIWITLVLCILMVYVMLRTKFGNNIYAIGGSEKCAELSGIKIDKIRLKIYIVSGFFAALSGILLASKSNSASPIAGSGYEFDAIAAVIIGGTPFEGGKGGVAGTIIGAILIRMLKNGLNLMGFTPPIQYTLIGLIIMTAIVVDVLNEKRKKMKESRRKYADER